MKRQKTILYLTFIVVFMLGACNLPSSATDGTPTVDPLIAAQETITALAEQATPTQALPSFTPPPTLSPTPEFTVTSALTSTPTFAYVTLSEATNCRVGPGQAFTLVDTFLVGQTIEVVGKHPFDNYWYVRSPNNPSVQCWMWGFYATGANLNNVPVLTPPPTYTPVPAPSFNASYVNSGNCVVPVPSWWTRINLTNTGQVAFRSITISIRDTVTNETKTASKDGFQDVNACLLSSVTSSLGPGEAYTVVAPTFSADPSGHLVSATITLCTETGQGGTCTSKTIEFTP